MRPRATQWSLAAVAAMSLWLVGVLASQISGWLGVAVLFFMPFAAGATFLLTRRRAWVYSWPASRRDAVQPPVAHPVAMLPAGPGAAEAPMT